MLLSSGDLTQQIDKAIMLRTRVEDGQRSAEPARSMGERIWESLNSKFMVELL